VLRKEHDGRQHNESTRLRSRHFREGLVEIIPIPRPHELKSHGQLPRGDFGFVRHVSLGSFTVGSGLPEDSDASDSWYCLLKDFKALACEFWAEEGRSGDIAAGSRKAGNESTPNGIGSGRKDDRDRRGRTLGGQRRGRARGYNHINLEGNQFGRKSREPLEFSPRISVFNHDIPTLDITVVAARDDG
jgi:hypothetical protein